MNSTVVIWAGVQSLSMKPDPLKNAPAVSVAVAAVVAVVVSAAAVAVVAAMAVAADVGKIIANV